MDRLHRVMGAVVGAAVGDALGAPFEFQPAGTFGERFPTSTRGVETEMCGGEFTGDTQLSLILAASLLRNDGLDEADFLDGFRRWAQPGPSGTGQLMRTTPAAVFFARHGRAATMDAARRISALTHGHPAAGEGCAVLHELLRAALDGQHPADAVPQALEEVAAEHRTRWAAVLAPDWHPGKATETNRAVWPTLGSAVWAVRRAGSYEHALRLVLDLGGDTDTVGCVTGALAGALYGITGIPIRWTSVVHGRVPGLVPQMWELADLQLLAQRLDGDAWARAYESPGSLGLDPVEVAPGVWASDLDGARGSDRGLAVVSLCRTGGRFGHEVQRFAYLTDDETNTELAAVLDDVLEDMAALRADGRDVLVHCFGGASRTGLVLRAWLMRTEGLSAREATERVWRVWPYLGLWNDSFTRHLEGLGAGLHGADSRDE